LNCQIFSIGIILLKSIKLYSENDILGLNINAEEIIDQTEKI